MKLSKIKDVNGNDYIGVVFPVFDNTGKKSFIIDWLDKLKAKFPLQDVNLWILNQQKRDRHVWHLTVFNVMECQKNPKLLDYEGYETFDLDIKGIGTISSEPMHTYYLICRSLHLEQMRLDASMNTKYFHITIAFTHKDLFHKDKDTSTLIIK